MLIFAVYDKKAMVFFPPFTVENVVSAVRGLEDTVNSPGNVINRYPDDFALYKLGEFDNVSGNFNLLEIKECVCECRQLVFKGFDREASGSVADRQPDGNDATGPAAKERQ